MAPSLSRRPARILAASPLPITRSPGRGDVGCVIGFAAGRTRAGQGKGPAAPCGYSRRLANHPLRLVNAMRASERPTIIASGKTAPAPNAAAVPSLLANASPNPARRRRRAGCSPAAADVGRPHPRFQRRSPVSLCHACERLRHHDIRAFPAMRPSVPQAEGSTAPRSRPRAQPASGRHAPDASRERLAPWALPCFAHRFRPARQPPRAAGGGIEGVLQRLAPPAPAGNFR